MPAPYAFNGRAGTRLALLRIGTGGRVASHLGTWSDRLLWGRTATVDDQAECGQSQPRYSPNQSAEAALNAGS